MKCIYRIICLSFMLPFLTLLPGTLQGPHERRLLNDLLKDYNTLERPVANESEALAVQFGLSLQQIIDVDEKNQIITTNIWLKLEWTDTNLQWNTSDYGGVAGLRIPPSKLWKPDILMYNSADEAFDGTYPTNIVVLSNGHCTYIPPGIFKSTCKIDITWFPFDDQKCLMKFGSWTYDGAKIDLQMGAESGDTSSFIENGEWDLIGLPGIRNVLNYSCCPEPYIDITFTIHIRRRTLYYGFNLIIPCVLISSMTLLGFALPPDSGEKLTLGVTILLSLTVFLLLVAEAMPPTSDAVPLIGAYFACIMIMTSASVVVTVLVLNYHHRNTDTHEMPDWIRRIFLQWMPWILRMSRPGRKITRKTIMINNKMKELELKERSSKSLLANVLDIEDDFRRQENSTSFSRVTSSEDSQMVHHCSSSRELHYILKELRYITQHMRKQEEETDLINDWKFAAMVLDRVCLIVFSVFTVVSSCAILFSAPHLSA